MLRIQYIDIAKGLSILWVIAVHTIPQTEAAIFLDNCSAFALPAFFLISGMFHRDMPVKDCTVKKFCQLIVPFCFFEAVAIVEMLFRVVAGRMPMGQLLGMVLSPWKVVLGPTWFLLALFETVWLFNLLGQGKIRKWRFLLIVFFALAGFYAHTFSLFHHHCHLPFFAGPALSMILIYACGYYFAVSLNGLKSWGHGIWFSVLAVTGIWCTVMISEKCFGGVLLGGSQYKYNFILTQLNALAGTFFLLSVCRLIAWVPGLAFLG